MCECKELIDKGVCDKGFMWNPSNCECECDESCDIGEYLDYSNCRSRKRLVDKLIEEFSENIEETSLIETSAKNKHRYRSCTVYMMLFCIFFIFFIINVGIAAYFVYCKYMSHNKENVSEYDYTYRAKNY